MSTAPSATRSRLSSAVLIVALLATGGIATELLLIGHWSSPAMMIPWAVVVGEVAAISLAATPPRPWRLRLVRGFAVVTMIAGWFGMIEHLAANATFIQELHPEKSRLSIVIEALSGGVPTLAPLAIALPAILAALTTLTSRGRPLPPPMPQTHAH